MNDGGLSTSSLRAIPPLNITHLVALRYGSPDYSWVN